MASQVRPKSSKIDIITILLAKNKDVLNNLKLADLLRLNASGKHGIGAAGILSSRNAETDGPVPYI